MKIAINARVLASPAMRGWSRYTLNLVDHLARLGADLILYSDHPIHDTHRQRLPSNVPIVVAPPMRYTIWEQRWLATQCRQDHVAVLHAPCNFGLPIFCSSARVLTLHDAIDAAFASEEVAFSPSAIMSRCRHWISRRVADRIITVSEFSRRDIVKCLQVPENQIDVIYNAADERFGSPICNTQQEQTVRRYQLSQPYIFYVGGWERRKNLPFLVRAFAQVKLPNVQFVLAGGEMHDQMAMTELARQLGIAGQVRLLGNVDDRDLPSIYAAALCFVYPSLYEGFGLQLCEAMAAGCPVLAARTTSLPEILGQGGATFTLDDTAELVALLRSLAGDPARCDQMRLAGRCRAKRFTWRITAQQTMRVYESARVEQERET